MAEQQDQPQNENDQVMLLSEFTQPIPVTVPTNNPKPKMVKLERYGNMRGSLLYWRGGKK